MVDQLFERSPWKDHVIGFKRKEVDIGLILDDEGQKKWDAKMNEIQALMDKYGYE